MIKLDQPPYFGVRQSGCIGCTLSGVLVDEDTHVLDDGHNPIPGLYAAGCDTGGFFAHTYYNLIAGMSGGRTITQARHAAMKAATESREKCLERKIVIDPAPLEKVEINPDDYTYTDGEYTGTVISDIGGELSVTVTITDGKISNIACENNETPSIGGIGISKYIAQAIEINCAEIDAVSNATLSYNAFREALELALEQAG